MFHKYVEFQILKLKCLYVINNNVVKTELVNSIEIECDFSEYK